MKKTVFLVMIAVSFFVSAAYAIDQEKESELAVSLKSPSDVYDAGMGNVYVANPWSTTNPAALGFDAMPGGEAKSEKFRNGATAIFAFSQFDKAPDNYYAGGSYYRRIDGKSAVEFSYLGGISNTFATRYQFDHAGLSLNGKYTAKMNYSHDLNLAYGRELVKDKLYVGVQANLGVDKFTERTTFGYQGEILFSEKETSDNVTPGFGVGILYHPFSMINLGGDFNYYNFSGTSAWTSRVGISADLEPVFMEYDLQVYQVGDGSVKTANYVGLELEVTKWLLLRGGYNINAQAWSGGIETVFSKRLGMLFGYMNNPFAQEVSGHSNLLGAYLYFYF